MNGLFGILFLLLGVFGLVTPRLAWYISMGWRVEDQEPSHAALMLQRVTGVFAAVIGLVLLLLSFSTV
ncbi:DUF6199 family natural product biosynthesis protein [Paenibacillus aquistagni]|uniref:DUF6199 domain-containing protein n=1 Tax=Paenibacillus aquistagni TaxID=1852522 RepID=A0A1X7JN23_9BACL|nr:DUF6199 family natural product biosynthesis protein [Paenibacillus aquistagni]NMM54394.1 hypothetical protein [Paenibacillus aquistagni]SMG29287.1 hypothetical protein SAMN06295960_1754 [Paenibacillus aquistagni]